MKKNGTSHKKYEHEFYYSNRGDRLRKEESEGDATYHKLFNNEEELKNKGKIVATDIDNEKIVGIDYDIKKVVSSVHKSESSGRIRIRRIGKDPRVGARIW